MYGDDPASAESKPADTGVLRAVFDSGQDRACMQQMLMLSLQLLYQTPSCWSAKCQKSDCCASSVVADFGLVAPCGSCAISIHGHLSLIHVCAHTFSAGSQVAPRYFFNCCVWWYPSCLCASCAKHRHRCVFKIPRLFGFTTPCADSDPFATVSFMSVFPVLYMHVLGMMCIIESSLSS